MSAFPFLLNHQIAASCFPLGSFAFASSVLPSMTSVFLPAQALLICHIPKSGVADIIPCPYTEHSLLALGSQRTRALRQQPISIFKMLFLPLSSVNHHTSHFSCFIKQSIVLIVCMLILISLWLYHFNGTTEIYINICNQILHQKEYWERNPLHQLLATAKNTPFWLVLFLDYSCLR